MNNTQLIQIAKHATRNDTVLQRGIIDMLCDALIKSDEQVRLLTEQRDAVVAENTTLKSCAEFYSAGFIPKKGSFGLEWVPTEKLLEDCGNVASDALQTPATDAFLAYLRAEGVEMLREHPAIQLCSLTHVRDEVAAQLRSQSAPSPEAAAITRQFEQVKGVQS